MSGAYYGDGSYGGFGLTIVVLLIFIVIFLAALVVANVAA